jgi:hypothetical protein
LQAKESIHRGRFHPVARSLPGEAGPNEIRTPVRWEPVSRKIKYTGVILSFVLSPVFVRGQALSTATTLERTKERTGSPASQSNTPSKSATATPVSLPATPPQQKKNSEGKQTNRILWVVPNFAAVSAGSHPPPLSAKGKFVMATRDSVDYTSFVWSGLLAAQSMALRSYPELGNGPAGYGRYYWRSFVDQASGAYFTEAVVPALRHEDPRYYTLGHGGFFRRIGYALSRVVLTKMDSGGTGFNFSEIAGNGMEAALSNLYYPPQERGVGKTAANWGAQIESAALNNMVKEFWPDIRRDILRQK